MQPVVSLRSRFVEWVQALDPSLRRAVRGSLAPCLGAGLVALTFILVVAWLPSARGFFQLRALPALACWLLSFSVIVGLVLWDRRSELSPTGYGVALLVTAAALQFSASSLVALSKPPGAVLMAGAFVALAGYCGHHHCVSLRQPFGLAAVAAALAAALAIDTSSETLAIFAVAGPGAAAASWLFGASADRQQRARRQAEALHAASRAAILEERTRDTKHLSDAMLEVGQAAHDANNALFTALIEVDGLRRAVRALHVGGAPDAASSEALARVDEQLDRLRGLLQKVGDVARARGAGRVEALSSVDATRVAHMVLRAARARFPEVDLRLVSPETMGVLVCGGEGSLRRILESLVFSACQGDGDRGARRVEVELESSGVGGAAIHVRDGGPVRHGAGRDERAGGFESAKPVGHELGRDTAARLVEASGGSLRRENRDEGGSVVSVFLTEAEIAAGGGQDLG